MTCRGVFKEKALKEKLESLTYINDYRDILETSQAVEEKRVKIFEMAESGQNFISFLLC